MVAVLGFRMMGKVVPRRHANGSLASKQKAQRSQPYPVSSRPTPWLSRLSPTPTDLWPKSLRTLPEDRGQHQLETIGAGKGLQVGVEGFRVSGSGFSIGFIGLEESCCCRMHVEAHRLLHEVGFVFGLV